MNAWYRLSLPSRASAMIFLITVALADLSAVAIRFSFGFLIEADGRRLAYGPIIGSSVFFCFVAAAAIGYVRCLRYPHPGSAYESLLTKTPWRPDRRLPLGPWHPVIQDVVSVGFVCVVAMAQLVMFRMLAGPDSLQRQHLPVAFDLLFVIVPVLISVTYVMSWTLCGFGAMYSDWNGAFLWPSLMVGGSCNLLKAGCVEAYVFVLGASVLTGVVLVVMRMKRLLVELPERHLRRQQLGTPVEDLAAVVKYLAPSAPKQATSAFVNRSRQEAVLIGCVVGLWFALFPDGMEKLAFAAALIGITALVRGLCYVGRIQSHLGLLARWGTQQWIVPSYDRCWVPSVLMATSAGVLLLPALAMSSVLAGLMASLAMGISSFIGLASGPDFERWSLTAACAYDVRRSSHQVQRR